MHRHTNISWTGKKLLQKQRLLRLIHGSSKPSIHLRYLLILEMLFTLRINAYLIWLLVRDFMKFRWFKIGTFAAVADNSTDINIVNPFGLDPVRNFFFILLYLFYAVDSDVIYHRMQEICQNAKANENGKGKRGNEYSHLFQFTTECSNIKPNRLSLSLSRCSNSQRHPFFKYILLCVLVWLKEAKENTIRKDW